MKSRLLLTIIFSLTTVLLSAAQAQISESGNFSELQGKTCKILITNKVKASDKKTDVLIFSFQDFKSSICTNANMRVCSKEIYNENGVKYFTIEFKCEHSNKMIWEGTIKNNVVSGMVTSVKGNKSPITYLFSGTIENE